MSRWFRVLSFGGRVFGGEGRALRKNAWLGTYLSASITMALGASAFAQGNIQAITPVDVSSRPATAPIPTPEPQTNPQTAPTPAIVSSAQTQPATIPATNPASNQDGPSYRISNLLVGYKFPHPDRKSPRLNSSHV